MEDIDIIKNFLQEMASQDNRLTATPFYYVIRSAIYVASYHSGEGDRDTYVNNEDSEDTLIVNSGENAIDNFREQYKDYEEFNKMDDEEIETHLEDNYTMYSETKTWEERNMFLTEKDAERHLRLNHYHYSQDAHTYIKHAWRAPDLEAFFKALFKYFIDK